MKKKLFFTLLIIILIVFLSTIISSNSTLTNIQLILYKITSYENNDHKKEIKEETLINHFDISAIKNNNEDLSFRSPIEKNENKELNIYQLEKILPIYSNNYSQIKKISSSKNGDLVFILSMDKTIKLWYKKNNHYIILDSLEDNPHTMILSLDESYILASDLLNVYLWKLPNINNINKNNENVIQPIKKWNIRNISSFTITKNNSMIAGLSNNNKEYCIHYWKNKNICLKKDEQISHWKYLSKTQSKKIQVDMIEIFFYLDNLNKSQLLCLLNNGNVLDINNDKIITDFSKIEIVEYTITENGIIYIFDSNKYIHRINIKNKKISSSEMKGYLPIIQLKISPQGNFIAFIDNQGIIYLWDLIKLSPSNVKMGGNIQLNLIDFDRKGLGLFIQDSFKRIVYLNVVKKINNKKVDSVNGVLNNYYYEGKIYNCYKYVMNIELAFYILAILIFVFFIIRKRFRN